MSTFTSGVHAKELTDLLGIGVTLDSAGAISTITGVTIRRVAAVPTQTDNAGSLAMRTNGTLYITTGAGAWTAIGGGGSGWNLPDDVAGVWGTAAPGQVSSTYVSASNRWDLSGDSISQATAASGTDLRIETGTNTITGAVAGNASGVITIRTGITDSTNAGGTAGASGAITVRSGNSTSTLGTSGSTGEVALVSGDSTDANSGNVTLTVGSAGGTRGVLDINAATVDTTTQATQLLLIDNTAAALQIGSSGDLDMLTFVTTEGSEVIVVRAASGLRLDDQIPLRFGTPGTDLVYTPDGTNVIVTSTGVLIYNNDVVSAWGTTANDRVSIEYDVGNNRFELTGSNITAGGATQATRPILIQTGNRTKTDNNAGVPGSGAISVISGATSQTTAVETGGASGAMIFASGATDVTFAAATGGASGAVTIQTGDTDISAAVAATGGASGNLIVRTGAATSTGATATSGASGTAIFGSGASADANTGTVNLQSGDAAGTGAVQSGLITVRSGTVGGTGTTGGVTIVSGAPVGVGISGSIIMGSGNVAGTGTTGDVTITSGDTAGAGISGSIAIRAGATVGGGTRGQVTITGIRTTGDGVAAITAARILSLADSGGVFSVSQGAAYDIDLPSPTTGPGTNFDFCLTAPGANNVTLTVAGAAATFVGTIVNDVTSVLPATGATLTFPSGVSALGDNIQIRSISTSLYLVRAVTSVNGGITIT